VGGGSRRRRVIVERSAAVFRAASCADRPCDSHRMERMDTRDMDFFVSPDEENVARLRRA
jgi:hypothetical protein